MDYSKLIKDKTMLFSVMIYEFFGTAFLLCSINIGAAFSPAVSCGALLLLIHVMVPISGCVINPGITLGLLIGYWGRDDFREKVPVAIILMICQFAGAFTGCALCWSLREEVGDGKEYPLPLILCPPSDQLDYCDPNGRFLTVFVSEIIVSFQFITTCLSVIYANGTVMAGGIQSFAILYCTIMFGAPISGAAINPSVGMSLSWYQNLNVKTYPNSFRHSDG